MDAVVPKKKIKRRERGLSGAIKVHGASELRTCSKLPADTDKAAHLQPLVVYPWSGGLLSVPCRCMRASGGSELTTAPYAVLGKQAGVCLQAGVERRADI